MTQKAFGENSDSVDNVDNVNKSEGLRKKGLKKDSER